MAWKNLPSWLKGGLIGLIVFIIISILSFITPSGDMGNIFAWAMFFPSLPIIAFFVESLPPGLFFEKVLLYIVMAIPYILAGIIIGWIIGKIKEKGDKNGMERHELR